MDYSKKIASGTITIMLSVLVSFFILVVLILLFFLIPWLFIWSVNLLFGLEIAFNFWNSVAAYVLIALFAKSPRISKVSA